MTRDSGPSKKGGLRGHVIKNTGTFYHKFYNSMLLYVYTIKLLKGRDSLVQRESSAV